MKCGFAGRSTLAALACAVTMASHAQGIDDIERCRSITDAMARLACYDALLLQRQRVRH